MYLGVLRILAASALLLLPGLAGPGVVACIGALAKGWAELALVLALAMADLLLPGAPAAAMPWRAAVASGLGAAFVA